MLRAAESARITDLEAAKVKGLVYFPIAADDLRLAWELFVDDGETPNVYWSLVDAVDGTVLWRMNLTSYAHQMAIGDVYTNDGPDPHTPTGTSTGVVPRDTVPFDGEDFFPHDDPHADWWNGSGEADRNRTVSNNVIAREDRDGDNSGGITTTTGEDYTATNIPIDLTMDPSTYSDATVVNLFYWINYLHDFWYRFGLDEESGNAQTDNFGLGGMDSDQVNADAQEKQDDADPPKCNAFMQSAGTDGTAPTNFYYQCGTGPERDMALDNTVIVHEYGHLVFGRLIDTVTNFQGSGMNEGFSDFFALSVLAEPDDDVDGSYSIGCWSAGDPNCTFRRQLYSTDQSVFTRTYANIVDGATCAVKVCSNDDTMTCGDDDDCGGGNTCDALACSFQFQCEMPNTTISQGPCDAEEHRTGEIWANTMWLARANMVKKFGFDTAHTTIHQLSVDGLKFAPDEPDFLDVRDSLLLADLINNSGATQCLLWDAFAAMGMGVSALSGGSEDINVIEAFDTPPECTPNIDVSVTADFGDVCVLDDTLIPMTVFNTGTGDLIVGDITVVDGDEFIVDPTPSLPVVIGEGAHVDFNLHHTADTIGAKSAVIEISSNDDDDPVLSVDIAGFVGEGDLDATLEGNGLFGDIMIGQTEVRNLELLNTGACPLIVGFVERSSGNTDFTVGELPNPLSFPVTLEAGTNFAVPINFTPSDFLTNPKTATITVDYVPFITADTMDTDFEVEGSSTPPDIDISGDLTFGDLCLADGHERTIDVCNVGETNSLEVSSASLGACDDFEIVGNPFPATISHDFCIPLTVRYTPTGVGDHMCTLTIVSDDPDEGVVEIDATGSTPAPSISVADDQAFPPTVIQPIGPGMSKMPFPITNTGACDVDITNVAVSVNPEEYSLLGLPPGLPITLGPGEQVGDGALESVFEPLALDRDAIGEVTVTWETDPVTEATADETVALCGEGVHTGARVLVVDNGVPLDTVKQIKLLRVTANRNGAIKLVDTGDVARNVPLSSVTPDGVCEPFEYHREYGTVSNPIQLLPGAYLVRATARINGRMLRKNLGFSVDTTDFNQTIVIEMQPES